MNNLLNELVERYPCLSQCADDILKVEEMMFATYNRGGKILICGNGGSCADCEHIVGELMKGFKSQRPMSAKKAAMFKQKFPAFSDKFVARLQEGIPAVSLCSQIAANTAFANDVDADYVFAQAVFGLAKQGDMLLAISTSGNSQNVFNAALTASALGISTSGLTGLGGGKLRNICDCCICVPETETFKVQELHLPVYHYLCAAVERRIFVTECSNEGKNS